MVSLFTRAVARGVSVPVIDPRLKAHAELREVRSQDEESAAQPGALAVQAPATEQTSRTTSASEQ